MIAVLLFLLTSCATTPTAEQSPTTATAVVLWSVEWAAPLTPIQPAVVTGDVYVSVEASGYRRVPIDYPLSYPVTSWGSAPLEVDLGEGVSPGAVILLSFDADDSNIGCLWSDQYSFQCEGGTVSGSVVR